MNDKKFEKTLFDIDFFSSYDGTDEYLIDCISNNNHVKDSMKLYLNKHHPELKQIIRESIDPSNKDYDEIAREIAKLNLDVPYCISWNAYTIAKLLFKKKKN